MLPGGGTLSLSPIPFNVYCFQFSVVQFCLKGDPEIWR